MFTKTYTIDIKDIHDNLLRETIYGKGAQCFLKSMLFKFGDVHVFTRNELKDFISEYLSAFPITYYTDLWGIDLLLFLDKLTLITGLNTWFNKKLKELNIDKR